MPKPKIVRVCQDCTCVENGVERVIEKIESETGLSLGEKNKSFDLDISGCLGSCDFGPNILVNNNLVMGVKPETVMEEIENAVATSPLTQEQKEENLNKLLDGELL